MSQHLFDINDKSVDNIVFVVTRAVDIDKLRTQYTSVRRIAFNLICRRIFAYGFVEPTRCDNRYGTSYKLTRSRDKIVSGSFGDVRRISRHHYGTVRVRMVAGYVAGIFVLGHFLHQFQNLPKRKTKTLDFV